MMLTQLHDQLSISAQVTVQDTPVLEDYGIQILIDNRPDDGLRRQSKKEAIPVMENATGIDFAEFPFAPGKANIEHRNTALGDLLKRGQKLWAYCRTGTRSNTALATCSTTE